MITKSIFEAKDEKDAEVMYLRLHKHFERFSQEELVDILTICGIVPKYSKETNLTILLGRLAPNLPYES